MEILGAVEAFVPELFRGLRLIPRQLATYECCLGKWPLLLRQLVRRSLSGRHQLDGGHRSDSTAMATGGCPREAWDRAASDYTATGHVGDSFAARAGIVDVPVRPVR